MKVKSVVMSVLTAAMICISASSALAQSPAIEKSIEDFEVKPIVVNGISYSYKDGAKFAEVISTVQHTVVDTDGTVYGYTDKKDADAHIQRITTAIIAKNANNKSNQVQQGIDDRLKAKFYEHQWFDGSVWDYTGPGEQFSFEDNWWNDQISSIKTPQYSRGIIAYEHSGYEGRTLFIPAGYDIVDLRNFKLGLFSNWNDRISSIQVLSLY